MDDLAVAVWFAGMIDELRAVAAATPVNRPIKINAADVETSFVLQTALDFVTGNSFACVLGDLAPLFEGDGGETTSAVNPGWSDFNARRQVYLLCPAFAQNTDNGP